ncbi:uncharacterized protein LOC121289215 isoform X1 [Carcharodon carcharias]|uniref:uncharacterized protein LOC121289215 isoform X1 n=1 Tax=Carcharodon carcharias TaxID=13397 RepID=UPI001B7F1081|nr:uncharacterized protein LOC121289215 isoform X1 [Carcharodon carcharias]XP_041064358.1 uncharacterized protein LOC121289215 isoform X1 [Carcharodon carcharias]
MEVKHKDYTFSKESHSNSVFHLTREHLELLVIWSHCHGNQCTFTPTWREIVEEDQNGILAILWECEAGHSYHWWTGGICQLPCDQDKSRGLLPSKSKQLEDVLASAVQIRKPHRIKTNDGDLTKETDSFDGPCKPFLSSDKAVRNGASVSQIPSTHHSWRESMFGGDRGKLGVSGTMGEAQAGKKPDILHIKTEKEETSDFSDQCVMKDENRGQNRELKKYHLGKSSLAAGQSAGHNISSADTCVSNGYRKRSSSVPDDQISGSSIMSHCNNGKVHIAELHHSPHPMSRGSCLTGSLVENTMKPSDVSAGEYCIGSANLANHERSGSNLGPLLDSDYIRPLTHNRVNSDVGNPELQCDPPEPSRQEGVLEFLHTILKADVVDEVFSNVRLANETDVEVLTENLSGKEDLLLDAGIQTNARLYFSAGGWAAVSATLEVLGTALERSKGDQDMEDRITEVSDSGPELMIVNPYPSCNMLNAAAMDEEQIVVAHVPALLPSADDKKRKVKYPVTKGEIRRRIIPPEKMSKTVIKSYLRLRRDNRFDIRQLLDLPVTGYDRTLHTSFTRLCEGEAKTLTENFHQLNLGYFPVDECASTIAEHAAASEIYAARKVIEDLDTIMDSFMWQEHPYNLITHGFGPQNIKVVLDLVKLLLRESLRKTSS